MKTYKLPFKLDYVRKYQVKDGDDNVILEFKADKKYLAVEYVNYINEKYNEKNKIVITHEMQQIQDLNNSIYK